MSDADVLALRGLLYLGCPACGSGSGSRKRVEHNVRAALRLEPLHLRARAIELTQLGDARSLSPADVRPLAEAHPKAWLPWLLLAQVQSKTGASADEIDESVSRALSLAPHQPYALMFAAISDANAGRQAQALQRSTDALRLQRTNPKLVVLRMGVLVILGRCNELEGLSETLSSLAHGGVSAPVREAIVEARVRCKQVRDTRAAPPQHPAMHEMGSRTRNGRRWRRPCAGPACR